MQLVVASQAKEREDLEDSQDELFRVDAKAGAVNAPDGHMCKVESPAARRQPALPPPQS